MKRTNKFTNNRPRKIMHEDCDTRCKIPVAVAVLSVLLWAAPAIADTTYTVDSIAEGLLVSAAKFTNLRLDYTFTYYGAGTDPNGPRLIVNAVYMQKSLENQKASKCLRYLDHQAFWVDPNKEQMALAEDKLVSFDGQATTSLDRKPESGKLMEGYIINGYDPNHFSSFMLPHTEIWYFPPSMLLGDFINKNRDGFYIESESEVLEGISTIKLVGTWIDPHNERSFTMKLWVSPQRNFLPMKKQVIVGGRMRTEIALYDLVQLPNGMWYPKTVRFPAEPSGIPDVRLFKIYDISEILIEPIPEGFFKPEFPPQYPSLRRYP